MSDVIYENNLKVYFLPAIADIAAPTTTEIGAGDRLVKITKDGFSVNMNEGTVDSGDLDTTFNGTLPGGISANIDLTIKRDNVDESATFDLTVRDAAGYLVVSPFGLAVATSKVHVFPGVFGTRRLDGSGSDKNETYMVKWFGTDPFDLDAVVAA